METYQKGSLRIVKRQDGQIDFLQRTEDSWIVAKNNARLQPLLQKELSGKKPGMYVPTPQVGNHVIF